MNRTIRAIIGVILVMVITFCAISVFQNMGKSLKLDVTEQKIYTLSDGTKEILGKLHQPLKMKLYYAKTAALKGPDQIRFFNNYYYFVKALLEEYVAQSKGMVNLEVIDPRPYSDEEVEALGYGLKRFAITEEENFFFGLVVQTPFGVEKTIPFFSPDRQNFVEYDISYLIDTAVTREKNRIGIISSLPVTGDDMSGYMAQMMRMQGQQPKPAWTIVEQLKSQYEVEKIATDVNDINDVDILLVIHPKDLPERTLFAIDQFILKGGRTIICVDPHCVVDQPNRQMQMQMQRPQSQSSELNRLTRTWGLEMPENTFAGDRALALSASVSPNQRAEPIIGYLGLTKPECFNQDNAITSELNQVRVIFAGALQETAKDPNESSNIELIPLVETTDKGNTWTVSSPYELMMPNPSRLMEKFFEGSRPVRMGYLVTGKLESSFPNGISIEVDDPNSPDPNEPAKIQKQITGLARAKEDCVVVVYSDVDFMTDRVAYQNSLFGKAVVGDNSAMLLNTIEDLGGSSELIKIRSRGNFRRPFTVVDEIEEQAEAETAEKVQRLNDEIEGFNKRIQEILSTAQQGQSDELVGSSIIREQKKLELQKRQAQKELNEVRLQRRRRIEALGNKLRNFSMLLVPAVILVLAILLELRRSMRRRHYISHASDA